MNNETPTNPLHRNVSPLRIGLIVASCFAIGAVGFFIAVLMEHQAQSQAPQPVVKQISDEQQKEAILQNLSETDTSSGAGSATSSQSGSATVSSGSGQDAALSATEAKKKILESLNSK